MARSHDRVMQFRKIFQGPQLDHFLSSLAALCLKGSLLRQVGEEQLGSVICSPAPGGVCPAPQLWILNPISPLTESKHIPL